MRTTCMQSMQSQHKSSTISEDIGTGLPDTASEYCSFSGEPLSDEVAAALCLQLREIAPEFYTPLQCHTSWVWVIWKFVSDPEVGPWTRMKRDTREGTDGGLEPIALHKKTAFADITNLASPPSVKAVKSS